jgi:hypothetical protein
MKVIVKTEGYVGIEGEFVSFDPFFMFDFLERLSEQARRNVSESKINAGVFLLIISFLFMYLFQATC